MTFAPCELGELPPAHEYRAVRAAAHHLSLSTLVDALESPAAMSEHFVYRPDLSLAGVSVRAAAYPYTLTVSTAPSAAAQERFETYYSDFNLAVDEAICETTTNPVRLRLRPEWMARRRTNQPKDLTACFLISPL